jgi:hypothetical protein
MPLFYHMERFRAPHKVRMSRCMGALTSSCCARASYAELDPGTTQSAHEPLFDYQKHDVGQRESHEGRYHARSTREKQPAL